MNFIFRVLVTLGLVAGTSSILAAQPNGEYLIAQNCSGEASRFYSGDGVLKVDYLIEHFRMTVLVENGKPYAIRQSGQAITNDVVSPFSMFEGKIYVYSMQGIYAVVEVEYPSDGDIWQGTSFSINPVRNELNFDYPPGFGTIRCDTFQNLSLFRDPLW